MAYDVGKMDSADGLGENYFANPGMFSNSEFKSQRAKYTKL